MPEKGGRGNPGRKQRRSNRRGAPRRFDRRCFHGPHCLRSISGPCARTSCLWKNRPFFCSRRAGRSFWSAACRFRFVAHFFGLSGRVVLLFFVVQVHFGHVVGRLIARRGCGPGASVSDRTRCVVHHPGLFGRVKFPLVDIHIDVGGFRRPLVSGHFVSGHFVPGYFIHFVLRPRRNGERERERPQRLRRKRFWLRSSDFLHTSLYRRRMTIGQLTMMPTEPNLAPPGPVMWPCLTKRRMSNSPLSRER